MKTFLVLERYLHVNLTLNDVSKCKAAVGGHFVVQS